MKIVSLLPSATEMVALLTGRSSLLGRSHECDFPQWVKNLPICTTTRFPSRTSSQDIHKEVQNLLESEESLYAILEKPIKELKPDFIVTQVQCEVCAVSHREVKNFVESALSNLKSQILTLKADRWEGLWEDLEYLSEALGRKKEGIQIIQDWNERIQTIQTKTQNTLYKPRILCIEWLDPPMISGNWLPKMIELLGAENIHTQEGQPSSWVSWDYIFDQEPDFVFVFPCGFSIDQSKQELFRMEKDTPRVFQNFNRPGPRLIDSLEILAEIVHPKLFSFGYSAHLPYSIQQ